MPESYPTTQKEWLGKVISFDTTSHKSNIPLMDYIKTYLKTFGIESTYVYNPEKTHANLWATFPGEGGVTTGGIILSGHVDVVPVDGQKWDSDPFIMTERNGKLYGRGTSDMKGFIAVCLAMTPTIAKMKRAKPVHFAFSFDEERGCAGVPFLTDELKAKGFKADCCLVGDGAFGVCAGSKGFFSWKVVVKGKAIHSSMALMNTSCNAIEYAAMIVAKIREIAMDVKKNTKHDPNYNCPFSCMSVGTIKGGNAVNTVPAECDFIFSLRVTDNAIAKDVEGRIRKYIDEKIVPEMKKESADAGVEMVADWYAPAFNADENSPYIKMVRAMLNDHKIRKAGGGTEAGFFEDSLKIPTVICGPGGANAHLANEYTTEKHLERSYKFTEDLIQRVTKPGGGIAVPSKV